MSRPACAALLGLVSLLGVTSGVAAQPAPQATPGADQKLEAQKAFDTGGRHFDAKRYEEALATFRASHATVASPNTRLMIARCLRELGRDVEAYDEFSAVVAEAAEKGPRYESAAQAAREEQGEVASHLAFAIIRLATPREGVTVSAGG